MDKERGWVSQKTDQKDFLVSTGLDIEDFGTFDDMKSEQKLKLYDSWYRF